MRKIFDIPGIPWDPRESIRTLKHFLEDASNHKAIVQKFDFIGEFIQSNVKHIYFVILDSIYGEYFLEYANYFGRLSRLKKSMYGMSNSENLFADEITN